MKIKGDSLVVFYNNFEFSEKIGIEEIDVDSNYTEYMMYSKSEIKDLYEDGTIYEVIR